MLTKLFVTRPTLAVVLVALVVIAGALAAASLRVQELPNVDVPHVVVIIFYPAASPAQMLDGIVRPIEDELAGTPDLEHLESTSQQGFATINASFDLRSSKTSDVVEVQRRLQAVQSQLPPDLPTPEIDTFDPGLAAVLTLSVTSKTMPSGTLAAQLQNKIIPAIEQIPGVGHAQANGLVTPSIQVEVDPRKLKARALTINDVIGAIAGANIRAPGGILFGSAQETGINIAGGFAGSKSVADLPIDGAPYKVKDVAAVLDTHLPQRIFTYVNGRPSFFVTVQKAIGASEVDAARGVVRALPSLTRAFPGVSFGVIDDQSAYTGRQVTGVLRTLFEGTILVAIVLFFFLGSWRNAIAVLISIPTSLFITIIAMRIGGFTFDTVSLLAMTLITGILVDDSIVVLENIERHRELGAKPKAAAINGRLEIALAAIVITLVDVVVFAPIAFVPGIVGRFLIEFAIVVVVATLSSLLVSFTLIPALAGNWSAGEPKGESRGFARGFERVREWYATRALPWGLSHPGTVIGVAAVSLLGAAALVWPLHVVGFDFVPAQDNGQIDVRLSFPSGTPLSRTNDAVVAIERAVDRIDDLRAETAIAGAATLPSGGYIVDGAVGQVTVYLKGTRIHTTDWWASWLRSIAGQVAPDGRPVAIPATTLHAGSLQPIDYLVTDTAADPSLVAGKVYDALRTTPGAADVATSATSQAPELDVAFDHANASRLGVNLSGAATAIRAAFGGVRATQLDTPEGLKDVQVTYPAAFQRSRSELQDVGVRTATGSIVRIADVASMGVADAPNIIDRVDRQTVIHVTANVASGVALSNVETAFQTRLNALHLPATVRVEPNAAGNQQYVHDTATGMAMALSFALVLVFLLMVALYNSYLSPFIIMFSVPVAVVGALGSLALTRQTLNMFSLIGTVLLIGLVTKNGILLVDRANQLREGGMARLEAIRESARTRFRPIVMTTAAMVFGMLPLALGLDKAVASRTSLGIVVLGGLLSSLLLTLVLVPVIYVWLTHDPAERG